MPSTKNTGQPDDATPNGDGEPNENGTSPDSGVEVKGMVKEVKSLVSQLKSRVEGYETKTSELEKKSIELEKKNSELSEKVDGHEETLNQIRKKAKKQSMGSAQPGQAADAETKSNDGMNITEAMFVG